MANTLERVRCKRPVLTYVEGWHVIAEANRIFGYDAWDRETIATHCVWTGMANRQHSALILQRSELL